jgi:hypothetical protein
MVHITLGDKSNGSVVDSLHFNADPDADPDLTFHPERIGMRILIFI